MHNAEPCRLKLVCNSVCVGVKRNARIGCGYMHTTLKQGKHNGNHCTLVMISGVDPGIFSGVGLWVFCFCIL